MEANKYYKAIIPLLLMVLVTGKLMAEDEGTSVGLRAGINFQNINGTKSDGTSTNYDMVTGFNAGLVVDIPIAAGFFFQPGLLYSTKGAKTTDVTFGITTTGTVHLDYLEVPLNFLYKPALGSGHLIIGLGPYVAFGIGGSATVVIPALNVNHTEDVVFKNTVTSSDSLAYYVKSLDAGANILFGYEFSNKFSLQLNAQLGLVKINPDYGLSGDQTSLKNTGFGISAGYRF